MKLAMFRHLQIGLSLIELMVAMALGLLILSSLGYILVGSRATYINQDANARLQDTGRFSMEFIGRQVRAAAHAAITPIAGDGTVAFGDVPITASSNATSMTLQYQLTDEGQQPGEHLIQDCNGNYKNLIPYPLPVTNGSAINRGTVINTISFDIADHELQCDGNGGSAQPFAEGVEELLLGYTADNVTWTATPGNTVLAVKVCIRVRSNNQGAVSSSQTYNDCAGSNHTPTDTYLRRTFTSVFSLRSRIP